MIIIRSIIANIVLLLGIIIVSIYLYLLTFVSTRKFFGYNLVHGIGFVRRLSCFIAGVKVEIRGMQNIPKEACIIASKHQSILETAFLFNQINIDTLYAFKKEMTNIPLWGRLAKKFGGISIDRKVGNRAYEVLAKSAKEYLDKGYHLAIFPEGTRVKPGQNIPFKKGIAKLYVALNTSVVPVALNTGYFYPKGSFLIYPGKAIIQFLPAIKPGLNEDDFLNLLQTTINTATDKLSHN